MNDEPRYTWAMTRDEFGKPRYFVEETDTGDWVGEPFDTLEEVQAEIKRKNEYDEPRGAGADPFGRPDPQTHPEYWTE